MLLRNPSAVLARWRRALAMFGAEMEEATTQLARELVENRPEGRTRVRLAALLDGLPRHRDSVFSLFRDAGLEPNASGEQEEVRGSSGASPDSLLAYATLVHRDFSWPPEVDEVTPAVDAMLEVLPAGFRLGRTLVFGAGTARFVWELGRRLGETSPILALDVNPLPLLVTAKLMRGESVELWELPAHPRAAAGSSVARRMTSPSRPPPGLELVLADALEPPVQRGAFDTVLTPWFIDQVPPDIAKLVPLLRDLLLPGGAWLNQGPLVYDPARTRPAHRYAPDEVLELCLRGGFSVSRSTYRCVPYLASPVSSQGRTEHVLTFHATRQDQASRSQTEPEWLGAGAGAALPVPSFERAAGFVPPHPSVSAVLAEVDGRRSTREITTLLVERGELADDANAETVVRACLAIAWRARKR